MKSITVHRLDDSVARLIQAKAKAEGKSLNKTIKALLDQALGVSPRDRRSRAEDFSEFLGVWKKSEVVEFERLTADFRQVHEEEWR